jgi:flagellar biosynthetic protein FliQ
MNEALVMDIGRKSLLTVIKVASPMLGLGMLAGLLVSIFQATTQIQEQTLAFIPKIFAVIFAIMFFGPWMLDMVVEYTTQLFSNIPNYIG